MRKFLRGFAALLVACFSTFTAAQGGGFQIGEMGTRATGMGNAFTAVADDASAAWYNPAGLAFVEGKNLMLGSDVIIVPSTDFVSNANNPFGSGIPASSASKTFFVPHVYFSYTNPDSKLSASLGANSPFGLETDWPITTPFATSATFSRINMVNLNANVTFRVSDRLAIAGGVDYASAYNVDLNNTVQDMSGDGDGWGGNAALFYKGDNFNLGVSYRSRISVDVDGTAIGGPFLGGFAGQTAAVSTNVTLPDQINAGLAWMPNDAWTLSFDVDWVNWKTFDSIDITYAPSVLGTVITGGTNLLVVPENWDSTVAFRAGAEWKYSPTMRARFGYTFDPTPVNDPEYTPAIPDTDRHLFSVGYGYDMSENATIDLAYMFVYFTDRTQTASTGTDAVKNGSYKASAHVIAASLAYRF